MVLEASRLFYPHYVNIFVTFILHSGSEQFNGPDEANGSKAHQLSPSEDDDHTQNWLEVQGRLPRALLQVCFSLSGVNAQKQLCKQIMKRIRSTTCMRVLPIRSRLFFNNCRELSRTPDLHLYFNV